MRSTFAPQPLVVEILHDDLEGAALGIDEVFGGHAAVVEIEHRGVGGPPAHLAEAAARQAGGSAFYQDEADADRRRARRCGLPSLCNQRVYRM
jgi:hypothetical protein